jgi:hypothetical protein
MEVGGQRHALAALPPARDPLPIIQKTGRAPWSEWTGAENLSCTEIRSLYLPVRSESYPGNFSGGVKQIEVRIEGRENGDLEAVAP